MLKRIKLTSRFYFLLFIVIAFIAGYYTLEGDVGYAVMLFIFYICDLMVNKKK